MRKVTAEQGPTSTVKFIRQPREGSRITKKFSVIMYNHEIPSGDIEAMRQRLQDDWKATVREFGLEVMVGD